MGGFKHGIDFLAALPAGEGLAAILYAVGETFRLAPAGTEVAELGSGEHVFSFQALSVGRVLTGRHAATAQIDRARLASVLGVVAAAIEGLGMVVIDLLIQPFLGGLEALGGVGPAGGFGGGCGLRRRGGGGAVATAQGAQTGKRGQPP